jgi:hypothetical protein
VAPELYSLRLKCFFFDLTTKTPRKPLRVFVSWWLIVLFIMKNSILNRYTFSKDRQLIQLAVSKGDEEGMLPYQLNFIAENGLSWNGRGKPGELRLTMLRDAVHLNVAPRNRRRQLEGLTCDPADAHGADGAGCEYFFGLKPVREHAAKPGDGCLPWGMFEVMAVHNAASPGEISHACKLPLLLAQGS